jgi:hypothetical protein
VFTSILPAFVSQATVCFCLCSCTAIGKFVADQSSLRVTWRTWFASRMFITSVMCAAVCEDKRSGSPGVAAADVLCVCSFGADVPRRLQWVQLVVLVL